MGGSGSSSKKRSSKRKRTKRSDEARRKKKSKRNKSKKHLRSDDSDSSYSDDDSMSSRSCSSSSSEDERRGKKRPRSRRDVRAHRKHARRRSSRQERTEDSLRGRKRKKLQKKGDSESRKKSQRKKQKREVSISSASSDSQSCSTCPIGSSGSSEQSESECPRERSREKRKRGLHFDKGVVGTKRSKSRTPSDSSYGRYGDLSCSVSDSKEHLEHESNSRRLRSIVTFAGKSHEREHKLEDLHEEEIVYDRDECPSSRSNDSNDGGNKRELAYHSHVSSDMKRQDVKRDGDHNHLSYANSSQLEVDNPKMSNDSRIPMSTDGSGVGDLELILRQKALENLRKFRGLPKNAKYDADINPSSAANADATENNLKQHCGSTVSRTQVMDQSSKPILERNFSYHVEFDKNISGGKHIRTEYSREDTSKPVKTDYGKQNISQLVESAKLGNSHDEDHSNACKITDQSGSGKDSVTCNAPETSQPLTPGSGNLQEKVVVNSSHSVSAEPTLCATTVTDETSSKDQQNEAKDGSQFEQKTMSVMRGGEMVQVSYKVYIPKRTPALARRQLKR